MHAPINLDKIESTVVLVVLVNESYQFWKVPTICRPFWPFKIKFASTQGDSQQSPYKQDGTSEMLSTLLLLFPQLVHLSEITLVQ